MVNCFGLVVSIGEKYVAKNIIQRHVLWIK